MNTKAKEIFKLLSIPLILLGFYLLVYVVYKFLGLPSDDQLLVIIKEWFAKYGLLIVFVGALIEGFLLLGQYFPGGFIIFLGVISVGKDIPRASLVVAIVCIIFYCLYPKLFVRKIWMV